VGKRYTGKKKKGTNEERQSVGGKEKERAWVEESTKTGVSSEGAQDAGV